MIVIFHLDLEGQPQAEKYFDNEFSIAMKAVESLRKLGHTHVTMSNEPSNMVGKMGVTAVENGKTPDGEVYEWSKAGRAGAVRRGHENKPVFNDGELVRK